VRVTRGTTNNDTRPHGAPAPRPHFSMAPRDEPPPPNKPNHLVIAGGVVAGVLLGGWVAKAGGRSWFQASVLHSLFTHLLPGA
jgi:hypothetical protein